jgi:hypothetical protein
LCARYLLRLPGRAESTVDLGDYVRLSHLRIEATGLHDVFLGDGSGDQMLPRFTGRARAKSSNSRLTCSDADVVRLRSGAEPGPTHRQAERQVGRPGQ